MLVDEKSTVNSFADEREAIETRLVSLFDTNKVPVQYANINFLRKGTETIPSPYEGPSWIRLSIRGSLSSRTEVTRTFNEMNGEIVFSIFTRTSAGSNIGRQIADELFDIFNTTTFNGITTSSSTLFELPPNNGWYQLNLSVPYQWYRCLETRCSDK